MLKKKRPPQSGPATIIRLAEKRRDPHTVQNLQALLKEAMEGKIIGIIAAVHYGGREFAYVGSGSMCDCPSIGIASAHKLATKLLQANK
jgi:hypothetical protein